MMSSLYDLRYSHEVDRTLLLPATLAPRFSTFSKCVVRAKEGYSGREYGLVEPVGIRKSLSSTEAPALYTHLVLSPDDLWDTLGLGSYIQRRCGPVSLQYTEHSVPRSQSVCLL